MGLVLGGKERHKYCSLNQNLHKSGWSSTSFLGPLSKPGKRPWERGWLVLTALLQNWKKKLISQRLVGRLLGTKQKPGSYLCRQEPSCKGLRDEIFPRFLRVSEVAIFGQKVWRLQVQDLADIICNMWKPATYKVKIRLSKFIIQKHRFE